MLSRPNHIIRPARQQIRGIHHDRVGDGRGVDKRALGTLDLQAAAVVLEEQGDAAVVGVGAGADLAFVLGEDALGHGRVVQQAQRVVADVGVFVEEGFGEVEAEGDGAHDEHVERLALVEEGLHYGFEFDCLGLFLLVGSWSAVGVPVALVV